MWSCGVMRPSPGLYPRGPERFTVQCFRCVRLKSLHQRVVFRTPVPSYRSGEPWTVWRGVAVQGSDKLSLNEGGGEKLGLTCKVGIKGLIMGAGIASHVWWMVPGVLADEVVDAVVDEGGASAVVSGGGGEANDTIISILFLLAVAALSLLTLGVVYLSVTSWLDERQEKKDSETLGPKSKYDEEMEDFQDALKSKKKGKKKSPERATPKGFGKK